MAYQIHDGLYVSEDGNYGGGKIIIIDHDGLSEEQMEILDILGDNDKYDYVYALMNGQAGNLESSALRRSITFTSVMSIPFFSPRKYDIQSPRWMR